MTAADYAGIAVAFVTLLGAVTAMIQFLIKHYLSELKPNSGTSLRDQVNRLETRVDKIYDFLTKR